MSHVLYIDESGDEGIENLKSPSNDHGPHPLFFFGAYLADSKDIPAIKNEIDSIENKVGKMHFADRNHEQKVFCCQRLATLPIKCFGLVSDKTQLADYKSQAQKKGYFYNKNLHLLLENVGMLCGSNSTQVKEIIFEKKGNHDYGQLTRYLKAVRDDTLSVRRNLSIYQQPYNKANYLKYFNFEKIICVKTKNEEPLLKIADAVSNSLRRAFVDDRFGTTETRYINEIKNLFFCGSNGQIASYGIRPVMDFNKMPIKASDLNFLLNLTSASIIRGTEIKMAT